jgi:hypothetical protein
MVSVMGERSNSLANGASQKVARTRAGAGGPAQDKTEKRAVWQAPADRTAA